MFLALFGLLFALTHERFLLPIWKWLPLWVWNSVCNSERSYGQYLWRELRRKFGTRREEVTVDWKNQAWPEVSEFVLTTYYLRVELEVKMRGACSSDGRDEKPYSTWWDLRFSLRGVWGWLSWGLQRRVAWLNYTDVAEVLAACNTKRWTSKARSVHPCLDDRGSKNHWDISKFLPD